MYTITFQSGKYHCAGRLQDSTERWTEGTLEAAIKSMIKFAKYSNGSKITKKNITFLQPVQVVETKYVEYKP